MRQLTRNILVQCLMILALVTAGVSPACAFISGKMTMIEICGVDGLTQISVPVSQAPDTADHDRHAHDCGFCLNHATGKAITTPDAAIIDFGFVYKDSFSYTIALHQAAILEGRLPARGPPAIL